MPRALAGPPRRIAGASQSSGASRKTEVAADAVSTVALVHDIRTVNMSMARRRHPRVSRLGHTQASVRATVLWRGAAGHVGRRSPGPYRAGWHTNRDSPRGGSARSVSPDRTADTACWRSANSRRAQLKPHDAPTEPSPHKEERSPWDAVWNYSRSRRTFSPGARLTKW